MNRLWELLVENDTAGGKLVTTVVILAVAVLVGTLFGRFFVRQIDDRYKKYYARKIVRYVVAVLALIVLGILWRPFAGQLGLVIGLTAAGLAFAMQEVIGALAGFFNVLSGGIYRVGDRVELAGVRGDVIDVSPLRTKLMEIGSDESAESWVGGRQYTGRIVAISNKATFVEPVFNYSGAFEFLWEELTIPVAYRDDWHAAERILQEEAERVSASQGASDAIREMTRRYPMAKADVEPRVYLHATDNYLKLTARFVVPVRTARGTKDEMTRRILQRLSEAGVPVASTTQDLTVRVATDEPGSGTQPAPG